MKIKIDLKSESAKNLNMALKDIRSYMEKNFSMIVPTPSLLPNPLPDNSSEMMGFVLKNKMKQVEVGIGTESNQLVAFIRKGRAIYPKTLNKNYRAKDMDDFVGEILISLKLATKG